METLIDQIKQEVAIAKKNLLKRYSEAEINDIVKPIVEKILSQIKIVDPVQKIGSDN